MRVLLHAVYILYNDYYQIIIEVAQLRQHKQRLNGLRTQLGQCRVYHNTKYVLYVVVLSIHVLPDTITYKQSTKAPGLKLVQQLILFWPIYVSKVKVKVSVAVPSA